MSNPLHATDTLLTGVLIQGFNEAQDAVHLSAGSISRCFIQPNQNIPLTAAHFDGIQIIPKREGKANAQYALCPLPYFKVTQSVVDGETTPIQCCFASDGIFEHAAISDNTFRTSGQHFLTISGLLSGKITGNEFSAGADKPIKLYPARPGGNPDGKFNIWILHFKDDRFKYQPIECDTPELMQDFRQSVFNTADKFLINFDYDKFESLAAQVPNAGGRVMGREFQRIALLCGDLVTEYPPVEVNSMYLSDQGRKVLIECEGLRLSVYQDINGHETIGIGHLITDEEKRSGIVRIAGTSVAVYETPLTTEQAYRLFAEDIKQREATLSTLLDGSKVVLLQHQYDAIFNLYYNIGHGNFRNSTVWSHLQEGKFEEVPAAIRMWNKSRGKVHKGMVNKRERTVALWEGVGWLPFDPVVEQEPKVNLKVEPKMNENKHETKMESTTLQGIVGMVVSMLITYVVGRGWVPESLAAYIQPAIIEIIGALTAAYFTNRAWTGRLNAVKGFK